MASHCGPFCLAVSCWWSCTSRVFSACFEGGQTRIALGTTDRVRSDSISSHAPDSSPTSSPASLRRLRVAPVVHFAGSTAWDSPIRRLLSGHHSRVYFEGPFRFAVSFAGQSHRVTISLMSVRCIFRLLSMERRSRSGLRAGRAESRVPRRGAKCPPGYCREISS